MKEKILISWSGGKESALALYEIKKQENFEIVALLTTLNQDYKRISLHGVRKVLLEQQAAALGVSIEEVLIPKNCSCEEYAKRTEVALLKYKNSGVNSVAFGDIFLEDIRKYREDNLAKIKMRAIFPLWKKDSGELAQRFIDLGFRSVVTCIDSKVLDKKFIGQIFDEKFLSELPPHIDPCGENGEFHSFVYAGPIFKNEIKHTLGEVVLRDDRFYYCDLLPIAPVITSA